MAENMEWKKVSRPYGRYSVSSMGDVRNDSTGQVIKPTSGVGGYSVCSLSEDGRPGVQRQFLMHRLVAIAFLPKSKFRRAVCVNHKNGIKTDNRAENLEWVTKWQNSLHAKNTGLLSHIRGEKHHASKINAAKAIGIRAMHRGGFSYVEIARTFGLSPSAVNDVCRRKTWAHIPISDWG